MVMPVPAEIFSPVIPQCFQVVDCMSGEDSEAVLRVPLGTRKEPALMFSVGLVVYADSIACFKRGVKAPCLAVPVACLNAKNGGEFDF